MNKMIDDEALGSNDFPFKARVQERNAVMMAITSTYNNAVKPALTALREKDDSADEWAKAEIAKIIKEQADMKKQNAAEYCETIKPHAEAYEAAVAEAAKNNPLWRHEVNEG